MGALIACIESGGVPLLWLDAHDYAARLLAGGSAPLLDAAAHVAWQRKAQGLLRADVIVLPVAAVADAWLGAHPAMRAAMSAKSRALFPLKTLLADDALRAHLAELVAALRSAFANLPLALKLPSPRCWIALASAQAHGADADVETGEDEIDGAALYLADALRSFAVGADALLLSEAQGAEPASTEQLRWYQAVLNVCDHYRWDAGLLLPRAAADIDPGAAGFAFAVAPRPLQATRSGLMTPAEFWTGAAPAALPAGGFRYAEVPAAAQPEAVLQRLAALR